MAITSITQVTIGNAVRVTVVSDLSGKVYYHWYADGQWVGVSVAAQRTFNLQPLEDLQIDVIDTNDPDYDYLDNAPAAYPRRRTLFWYPSPSSDVDHYLVEETPDGDEVTVTAKVPHRPEIWQYQLTTGRLQQQGEHLGGLGYSWWVRAVDRLGNVGGQTALAINRPQFGREDAPNFALALEVDTTVTISAA